MTIHVLHAGDGYLYLIRSVAAHDGHLAAGSSLAAYYTASGQPPGRWAGKGARRLDVAGTVTEEQMRSLFGEGSTRTLTPSRPRSWPTASRKRQPPRRRGSAGDSRSTATLPPLKPLAHLAYTERESSLGRPLDRGREARRPAGGRRLASSSGRTGRAPLDPVELESPGTGSAPGGGRRLRPHVHSGEVGRRLVGTRIGDDEAADLRGSRGGRRRRAELDRGERRAHAHRRPRPSPDQHAGA